MLSTKENITKLFFICFGAVLFIASLFLPVKIIAILCIGIIALIVSFFHLEISFSMFFVVMSIMPHYLWNNMYIFYAAVFYAGVYLAQVLADKRKPISIVKINLPLLLFILFATVSLFISNGFSDSLRIYVLLVSSVVLGIVLMGLITDKKSLNIILTFICFGVFFTALYGLYQKMMGIEVRLEFIDTSVSEGMAGRLFSTMDNPNNYAEYLILFLPICFSYALNCKDEIKKLLFLLMVIPGIIALVFTLSRASYLAFVVGAFFYVLLVNKRLVPFFIILGIGGIPLMPDFIINRIMTIGKDSSSRYRFFIWEGVLRMLKDYWVQGIGIGPVSFKKVYSIYTNPSASPAMHSHNLLLQIWTEMGIAAFISFLGILFSTLKNNFISYLNSMDRYYKNLFAAFIYSLIAITIFSSVEYVWFYPRVMLCFWLVVGLSFGTMNLSRGEKL